MRQRGSSVEELNRQDARTLPSLKTPSRNSNHGGTQASIMLITYEDPRTPGRAMERRFGAVYSECGLYRYRLSRAWGIAGRTILWIMLNPSTADHLGNNDPTIERCERRSVAWGFERMEVVNLFALRGPDPRCLRPAPDPVGRENDRHILEAAHAADVILCAWGALGRYRNRSDTVRKMLLQFPLLCLGATKAGEPLHPLYLSYTRTPLRYDQAVE